MMVMTETEEDEAEEENDARSLSLVSVYGLRQIVVAAAAAAAAVAALLSEIRRVIARLRPQRSSKKLFLSCVSRPQRPEATHAT